MASGKTHIPDEFIYALIDDMFTIATVVSLFKPPIELPIDAQRINVTDIKVGMTVYKEMPNGKVVPDCILEEYFPTSDGALSFRTRGNQLVVWHPCGKVWVTYGKGM